MTKIAAVAPLAAMFAVGGSMAPGRAAPAPPAPAAHVLPIPNAPRACPCIRPLPPFQGKIQLVPLHRPR